MITGKPFQGDKETAKLKAENERLLFQNRKLREAMIDLLEKTENNTLSLEDYIEVLSADNPARFGVNHARGMKIITSAN